MHVHVSIWPQARWQVLLLLLVKPYFHRYAPGVALGEFLLMLLHPPIQALRSWFLSWCLTRHELEGLAPPTMVHSGWPSFREILFVAQKNPEKIRFGTAGNKQERAIFMAVFLALSVWTVMVVGYFLLLQTCAIYLDAWFMCSAPSPPHHPQAPTRKAFWLVVPWFWPFWKFLKVDWLAVCFAMASGSHLA